MTPHRWVLLAAAVVGAAACAPIARPDNGSDTSQLGQLLAQVQIVPALPHLAGYERGCAKGQACVFGRAWNDPNDHSGCDTRNRVLARDLHDVQFKPGTRDCKVIEGWEDDPYTGARITVHQVQIDHVYPDHRAWDAGAAQWTLQRRVAFANALGSRN
jgi:Protein of unknown function (DUF1524)